MNFKKVTQAILAITLVASEQWCYAEDWKIIDHYQVKDNLVKDPTTGLMWMRCSLGQNWNGSTCQGNAAKYTLKQATKASDNFSYAGYNDWRVPILDELKSLIYCSNGQSETETNKYEICKTGYIKPTILNEVFPRTPSDIFWTSTYDYIRADAEQVVNFDDGNLMSSYSKETPYAVQLVRGKQSFFGF